MDFNNFTVTPLTLALIILGVVEFIKKLGVTGNKLMLVSMGVGISCAVMYQLRELYLPAQPYVDVLFFGLAAGLGASGIYSFITERFPPQQIDATRRSLPLREEPAERDELVR